MATPIGNLGDITARALDGLQAADLIACEDSRVTAKLLRHAGIEKTLVAYHDHNAAEMRPKLLARIAAGERVALVSDAGTPLISDPGYKLVQAAIEAGLKVTMLPGPSAPIMALALSGLPSDRFLFAGFLPPKSGARRRAIQEAARAPVTLIFFETAPRLVELAGRSAGRAGRPAGGGGAGTDQAVRGSAARNACRADRALRGSGAAEGRDRAGGRPAGRSARPEQDLDTLLTPRAGKHERERRRRDGQRRDRPARSARSMHGRWSWGRGADSELPLELHRCETSPPLEGGRLLSPRRLSGAQRRRLAQSLRFLASG